MTTYNDGDTPVDLTPPPMPQASTNTPKVTLVCRECGGELVPVSWRAPMNAADAWRDWHNGCVWCKENDWSFCRNTGGCWVGSIRLDFERRKQRSLSPSWDGQDRRRPPTPGK